jgi:hypothetical protein
MVVLDFLTEHQAALLWGSAVLLVAGLALETLRQLLDEDDRDPERERRD